MRESLGKLVQLAIIVSICLAGPSSFAKRSKRNKKHRGAFYTEKADEPRQSKGHWLTKEYEPVDPKEFARQARAEAASKNANLAASASDFQYGAVNEYIKSLDGDVNQFNITLQLAEYIPNFASKFPEKLEQGDEIDTIKDVSEAFIQTAYANSMVTADAGRGKTSLVVPMVMIYSYDKMPEEVRSKLQITNPLLKKFFGSYIGKTQFINIDTEIFDLQATQDGERFLNQEENMKKVLRGLFAAAKADFKKNKRRTIFLFDEVALIPEAVQQIMKAALDKTGFKDPDDPIQAQMDSGISAMAMTTPWEAQAMISGDTAKQRRWVLTIMEILSGKRAMAIGKQRAALLTQKFNGLEIDEDAVAFLVKMNNFIFSPPEAMPGSTLKALDKLFSWYSFNRSENGSYKRVTLRDAHAWFLKATGKSDTWLPGPNGEPPFYKLEERVEKDYKGLPHEVIKRRLMATKAWARGGFSGPIPVFLEIGPTGSGKNTFVDAVIGALYQKPGQRYSIGAKNENAFTELFEGERAHGDSPGKLPQVFEHAKNNGGPAPIILDEAGDAPEKFYDDLKVFLETGVAYPIGEDSRPRLWSEPIFILGQQGKEIFEKCKTDEEVFEELENLTDEQIDKVLLEPKYSRPGRGVMREAFLQRIRATGDIYVFPPTSKKAYPEVLERNLEKYVELKKVTYNLDISVDDSLKKYIVDQTHYQSGDPRKMLGNMNKLVHIAIFAEGADHGIPTENASLELSTDTTGVIIKVLGTEKSVHIDFKVLLGNLALCKTKYKEMQRKKLEQPVTKDSPSGPVRIH